MHQVKENKSLDFSIDESNFDNFIKNISSRNSINTNESINNHSIIYHLPILGKDEIFKKRDNFNSHNERL